MHGKLSKIKTKELRGLKQTNSCHCLNMFSIFRSISKLLSILPNALEDFRLKKTAKGHLQFPEEEKTTCLREPLFDFWVKFSLFKIYIITRLPGACHNHCFYFDSFWIDYFLRSSSIRKKIKVLFFKKTIRSLSKTF